MIIKFTRVILLFCKSLIRDILKGCYSLYKLSSFNIGSNCRIDFPVNLRGKGKVNIGNSAFLLRNSFIGCDGYLKVGNNFLLGVDSIFIVESESDVIAGNNFSIEGGCILKANNKWSFGDNVFIASGTSIFSREKECNGKIIVGTGSQISNGSLLDTSGDIEIGDDVAIGSNCTIYTHNHIYDNVDCPAWKGGIIVNHVVIESGVWIGSNVTILPGVRIGKRSVVAAGSVVTKSVPDGTVYGGNPAKLIKNIF